jgi:membrane-bound lytic murein transglycosylase D
MRVVQTKSFSFSFLALIGAASAGCWAQISPAARDASWSLAAATARTTTPAVAPSRDLGADVQSRLNRANLKLQEGKRLLQEQRGTEARESFDRAVQILLEVPVSAENRAIVERRLEEMIDQIYGYDVDSLGAGQEPRFEKSPLDDLRELTFPVDPKLKNLVPNQLESTSSQLPLEINDTVLSFINYFTASKPGRNTLINGWRRSHRYRPMIQRILTEEGVPQELIFLAQAESGFIPRARSVKAACGMWQFVQFRGREYGLTQDSQIDLRLDPEKATRAAARHLRDLYRQFGDWYLAMAAYNCGPGCVSRAVERTGYADYWELHRRGAIPRETRNYVPIVLAMTIVTKNAVAYGLVLDDPEPALDYDTIKLTAPTHVELIAAAADYPISGIRELNPAILRSVAPAGLEVHLPKGQAAMVRSGIDSVPSAQRAASRLHRVKTGERLAEIAQMYRTTPKAILAANAAAVADIEEGDMLMVPASAEKVVKARAATAHRAASAKSKVRYVKARRPAYKTSAKRASR